MKKSALWTAFFVVLIGFAAVYYLRQQEKNPPPPALLSETALPAEEPAVEAVRHPVPEPAATEEAEYEGPLPALNESDGAVKDRFAALFDGKEKRELFQPDNLIRRIVVTVDNLPRKVLPLKFLPMQPPAGSFQVSGETEPFFLDEKNQKRYAAYVSLLESADTGKTVATYVRLYPLFQEAYRDLGYPTGHFNDRLVEVIDHLLATPTVRGKVELVQPKVFYHFADPALEELSAGQKIIIRTGPANAERIKVKLREFRRELTSLPRNP